MTARRVRVKRLMEVFKDFEVFIKGASCQGRYQATYKLVPRSSPEPLTVEKLEKYVNNLQAKYPDKGFYLDHVIVGDREFYVVTKKSWTTAPDGRRVRVGDRVPVYFDLASQRVYVPETYVKKRYKLACYILMRTLGALGLATVKYVKMGVA